jgi:hypothetical protein
LFGDGIANKGGGEIMKRLIQPVCEFTREPIRWLWPNNLALGNLALIDGDPGLGKSLASLDLCARLSTGRPFPGAETGVETAAEPASSIIFNAEDGLLNSALPRLQALGADVRRIFVLCGDYRENEGGFRLPSNMAALEEAIADTGARLVVMDPITSFLDENINIGSEMSVRGALVPLVHLARRRACALLLIRHLNKTAGTRSIYRGGGSIAFQGVCRSSWLVGLDPFDPERRVMAQVKNNMARLQASLGFALRRQGDDVALDWLGTSPMTGNQLLAAAGRKPDLPGPLERARDFLREYLQEGPRPTTEIWPAAQHLGFTYGTLRRARKREDIRFVRTWTGTQRLIYWLLPNQSLPGESAIDA